MKIASFTFDDGYIDTARKFKKLNIPATFYLVTGWLDKSVIINDKYNKNKEHGSVLEWKELGFDIGSHTHTHEKNINESESIFKFKHMFDSKYYNLSTPYSLKFNPYFFDSCKIGYSVPYNEICKKSLKSLSSININYDIDKNNINNIIKHCPDNHWMIFTFHGIEEGWYPTDIPELIKLHKTLIKHNFIVSTISEVVHEIGPSRNLL